MPPPDQDIALIPNEPIMRIAKPRRLYGRESAEASLMASFERISHGQGEVVLVPGHSGVGKTALVREIRKPVRNKNGFFLQGKFNQYQQNIPYFAVRQALAELARELQSEDITLRQQWVSKLRQAVGALGQLLVDLAPEFDALLGPQPPVAEIGALEARHRFAGVIRNLFDAVCGPEHPVVLFIDDWQWADTASFELLKELQIGSTLRYLLVIAPYRDNEVDHAHPLVAIVEELRHQTVPINIIEVKNLEANDVRVWLKEMLQPKIDRPDALAEFIHSKTGGNPFFTQASLEFLYDFGLLQFDHLIDCWRWKIATKEGFELSDNVEELFKLRLCRLDPPSQDLLAQAACLGNRFDLDSLAVISKSPADTCRSILLKLPEMIVPINHGHSSKDAENQWFMFVHDRVQQAAYGTISAKDLPSVRLKIGKLLLSRLSPEHLAERLFEVTDHLNMGQLLIEDSNEQVRAVELNVAAARKARAATAYRAALEFHRAAGRFLKNPGFADHLWNNHHPLALSLFLEWAESEFLEGNRAEAENYINQAVTHGRTAIEKAEALNILIVQNTLKARYPEAIAAGRQALAALGIILPDDGYEAARHAEIDRVRRGLEGLSVASLVDLPIMSDPEMRVAAKILIAMGPPCYRSHQKLWGVIVPKVVNLTLQYGNIPQVGYSHPAFAGLLCWVADDFDLAKEFGELASRLMTDVFHSPSDRSVYALMIGSSVRHWFQPLQRSSADYQEACEIGLQSGNLQYTAYAFGHNMYCRFYQGLALNDLIHESQRSLAFSQTRLNQWAIDLLEGGLRIFSSLAYDESDSVPETEYLQEVERHHNIQVTCIYKILKTFQYLILGYYQEALELSDQVEPILYTVGMQGLLPWPEHVIARLLILTALARDANEKHLEISHLLDKLRLWADQCPENFEPLYMLAQAELARLELKTAEAVVLYEQAIAQSQSSGCVQWEALSNEKAARFWQTRGNGPLALMYWQQAYSCFERWGSKAKLRAIEAEYVQCLTADLPQPTDPSDLAAKQAHDVLLEKQLQLLRSQSIRAAETRKWNEVEKQAEELALATENLRSEVAKRKSVEEELRLHREQLEDRVKERTAELEKILVERKQAEEALSASEKEFRFLAEAMPQIVWVTRADGWNTYFNQQWLDYTGLTLEESYGHGWNKPFHPEDQKRAWDAWQNAVNNNGIYSLECRLRRFDGHYRWWLIRGVPVLDESGHIVKWFGTCTDIDDIKRAAEAIQESEKKFKVMTDTSPLAIYMSSGIEQKAEYINPRFTELFGYTLDEVPSAAQWWPLAYPDEKYRHQIEEEWQKRVELAIKTHSIIEPMEVIVQCKDGSNKNISWGYISTGIQNWAFGLDQTERKKAELEREQYYKFFNAATDLMGIADPNGAFKKVNPTFLSTLGYSEEEVLTKPFIEFVHPEDRQSTLDEMARQLQRGFTLDFENRYICKDGSLRWLSWRCNVNYNEGLSYATARDITERKQHEEELRRYKDHLEEEVQQRTADLILARNAAEAANQAKSVFLANMSHELRTPLNAILGFSGMMRKDTLLLGSQRQNLDIINRSGEHLLTLINDVLEMAKIEAGRVQIENAPLDLGGMVRDISDMMQLRAAEKGLHMLIDQSSRFPRYIIGDEARLRQILINLIGNAVKFTQQGGVTLRLGTRKNKTEHLLIEVEDSGPGIAAKDQQRVFQPFVQLGEHKENKGTGLGLSITHQFVRLMGGDITLQSTPGLGSLFRIDLPLIESMDADIAIPKEMEKGEVIGLAPGQPEYRILIVEDQLENQLLLTKLLESVGFQVKVAEDGKQGVQMFQDWHPHFIWMDRRMPVMDGLEATRIIRKLPYGQDVKIVAVTASAFIEQRSESLEAGMDDFIRKPYRFNEIYECLSKQLGVRYIYRSVSTQEQPVMTLTPDMLDILPDDLRSELLNAVKNLESKRIEQVIRQIAPIDLQLQKTLAYLAENFDYPAILKALRENQLRPQ